MAKFITEISIENLSSKEFIAIAAASLEKLNASIKYVSPSGIMAETNMSLSANSWGENITVSVTNGTAKIRSESKGGGLIDFGRNKKVVNKVLDIFEEVKNSITPDELATRVAWVEANSPAEEEDILNPNSKAAIEAGKWWKIFIPSKALFVTPLVIDICIVLFILQVSTTGFESILTPSGETIIKWGSNFTPYTLGGQWWRLITNVFEHIGIIHLLFNMYALLYIGLMLEPLLGSIRFGAAYIATGIIASVTSLWWHDVTNSAGASGAIFGMYGLFGALLLTNLIEKSARNSMLSSIGIFVVYNLAYGMKSGVDNAAHVGGLVSGFAIGFIYFLLMKGDAENKKEKFSAAVAVVLAIIVSGFALKSIRNDVAQYESLMSAFGKAEERAIGVYQNIGHKSRAEVLQELKNTSMPAWKECRSIMSTVMTLTLPKDYEVRRTLLMDYSVTRVERDSLAIESDTQPSTFLDSLISEKDKKVETILAELNKQ